MKARIMCPDHPKDGTIVEMLSWSSKGRWVVIRDDEDPKKEVILYGVNFYKDLQLVSDEKTDRNEFRKQIIVKMMQALMSNPALVDDISCDFKTDIVEAAIVYTDKLIGKLQNRKDMPEINLGTEEIVAIIIIFVVLMIWACKAK